MRLRFVAVVLLLLVGLSSKVFAEPIAIDVVSAAYYTRLTATLQDLANLPAPDTPFVRETTSNSPIADAFFVPSAKPFGDGAIVNVGAWAEAGLFSVYSESNGNNFSTVRTSGGFARTEIEFAPVVDATGTIGIDILGGGITQFSTGVIQLFDINANQQVWNYSWGAPGGLPLFLMNLGLPAFAPARFDEETSLLASSLYRLTLEISTNASNDGQAVRINISGLQAVPEPSTLTLLALGFAGIATSRRRHRVSTGVTP